MRAVLAPCIVTFQRSSRVPLRMVWPWCRWLPAMSTGVAWPALNVVGAPSVGACAAAAEAAQARVAIAATVSVLSCMRGASGDAGWVCVTGTIAGNGVRAKDPQVARSHTLTDEVLRGSGVCGRIADATRERG